MLPTEGREYLEGLEVRGGEGSGKVTGVEWQGELGGRVTSVMWEGRWGGRVTGVQRGGEVGGWWQG